MPKKTVQIDNGGAFPKDLIITVPSDAKSGLLMLYGSAWNGNVVQFSDPSGTGIVSAIKLYDAYTGVTGLIHMVVYQVSVKQGAITTTVKYNAANQVSGQGSANMQLLY